MEKNFDYILVGDLCKGLGCIDVKIGYKYRVGGDFCELYKGCLTSVPWHISQYEVCEMDIDDGVYRIIVL